ncbi:hypothetical protein JMJ35_009266 [Cladonia borealis]|uniref:Uncharacterized protein n=1 Tax=Cladonia borealis TaxID=184061 RepID=A0AA39UY66_9LECA|nr:hypothetical protein JMJ35_009266 [Cladonia borealis]
MPVNWKAEDAYTRLLAAIVAANDLKLDYRKIATMYGNGATYDSIEGRFRIIRKEAAVMKAEVESGTRPAAPPRNANAAGSNSGQTTPKKPKTATKKDKTLTGRVSKSNTSTPPKKNGNGDLASVIKQEQDSTASSFSIMDDADAEGEEMMDGNVFFSMGEEGY